MANTYEQTDKMLWNVTCTFVIFNLILKILPAKHSLLDTTKLSMAISPV